MDKSLLPYLLIFFIVSCASKETQLKNYKGPFSQYLTLKSGPSRTIAYYKEDGSPGFRHPEKVTKEDIKSAIRERVNVLLLDLEYHHSKRVSFNKLKQNVHDFLEELKIQFEQGSHYEDFSDKNRKLSALIVQNIERYQIKLDNIRSFKKLHRFTTNLREELSRPWYVKWVKIAGYTVGAAFLAYTGYKIVQHASGDSFEDRTGVQLANKKKYGNWSSGILVGQKSEASKVFHERSVFAGGRTMEGKFLLGGFQKGGDQFHRQVMRVSFHDENVFQQYLDLSKNQTVILEYSHIHNWDPFYTTLSKYIIRKITPMKTTPLKKKFYKPSEQYVEGLKAESQKSGRIVHVSRWGALSITCTVYLHQGGTKVTNVKASSGKDSRANIPLSTGNIIVMVAYTEKGCQFAEKVAQRGYDVTIDSSEQFFEIWNHYTWVIHSMKIEN